MCHLPGVADPPEAELSMTALSKKRKMDARTEAASATHTFESTHGQSRFRISTPAKRVRGPTGYPVSKPESPMLLETKTQDMSIASDSAPKSIAACPGPIFAGRESDPTLVNALFERVAALEDRMSGLERLQAEPNSNGGSESETITANLATASPEPSWGNIADIVRVHDKDGNLIQGSTDV